MILKSLMGLSHDSQYAIRELHISDEPACKLFFDRLDWQDLRMRFASRYYSRDCFFPESGSENENIAFVAEDGRGAILGIINIVYLTAESAEIGLIVRSDHKRHGIGRALLAQAIRFADQDGLSQLIGCILAENRAMLALARATGFRSIPHDGCSTDIEVIRLSDAAAPIQTRACMLSERVSSTFWNSAIGGWA